MNDRILFVLERFAQVVRVLHWEKAKQHGLSPIQLQALLHLQAHPQGRCSVRSLAREFDLAEATVSVMVKALTAKGLVVRKAHPADGRISLLALTAKGKRLAVRLVDWGAPLGEQLSRLPCENREILLNSLLSLMTSLQRAGVIQVARICLTCKNFERNAHPGADRPHRCNLTNRSLVDWEAKMNCEEHEPQA